MPSGSLTKNTRCPKYRRATISSSNNSSAGADKELVATARRKARVGSFAAGRGGIAAPTPAASLEIPCKPSMLPLAGAASSRGTERSTRGELMPRRVGDGQVQTGNRYADAKAEHDELKGFQFRSKSMRSGTGRPQSWRRRQSGRRGGAPRCRAGGKGLDRRHGPAALAKRFEDDAFETVVIFRQDEVAEPLPDFGDDRRQLRLDIARVGAADRHLCLDLRVMRPKAELGAAVRHQRLDPGQHLVDMAFAKPVGMKA